MSTQNFTALISHISPITFYISIEDNPTASCAININNNNAGKKINIITTDTLVNNILCTVQSEKLLYFKNKLGQKPGKDTYQLYHFNTDTIQIEPELSWTDPPNGFSIIVGDFDILDPPPVSKSPTPTPTPTSSDTSIRKSSSQTAPIPSTGAVFTRDYL